MKDYIMNALIKLDAPSFKTLAVLSTYQDANGKCDPIQLQLAKRMGISLRTVSSHIRKLLDFKTPDGSKILEAVSGYKSKTAPHTNLTYKFLPASGFLRDTAEFRLKSKGTAKAGTNRVMMFDEKFLAELERLEKEFVPSDYNYSTYLQSSLERTTQ